MVPSRTRPPPTRPRPRPVIRVEPFHPEPAVDPNPGARHQQFRNLCLWDKTGLILANFIAHWNHLGVTSRLDFIRYDRNFSELTRWVVSQGRIPRDILTEQYISGL